MKPESHPSEHADVILYLDANMPEPEPCRRGCSSSSTHMCLCRFGPCIRVIAHNDRISFTRLTDLQVILDFIHIIQRRWGMHPRVSKKRYIIATHDHGFLASAKNEHEDRRNMQKLPLVWGNTWVHFEPGHMKRSQRRHARHSRPRAIQVEIHIIPSGPGDHEQDLRDILDYARTIRRQP